MLCVTGKKLSLSKLCLQDSGSAGFHKAYEQCVRSTKAFLEKHKGTDYNFIRLVVFMEKFGITNLLFPDKL